MVAVPGVENPSLLLEVPVPGVDANGGAHRDPTPYAVRAGGVGQQDAQCRADLEGRIQVRHALTGIALIVVHQGGGPGAEVDFGRSGLVEYALKAAVDAQPVSAVDNIGERERRGRAHVGAWIAPLIVNRRADTELPQRQARTFRLARSICNVRDLAELPKPVWVMVAQAKPFRSRVGAL